MNKKQLYEVLNNTQTMTTVILVYLFDKYNSDFIEWDSITFSQVMKEEFGEYPSQSLMDKFGAGTALLSNDLFFKSVNTFNVICSTLNNEAAITEMFLPADLDAIMWGCTEAKLILGSEMYNEEEFTDDIRNYAGYLLTREGIYKAPDILNFAEYPEDTETNMYDNLQEDPVFFELSFEKQQSDKEEITSSLNTRLLTLLNQLNDLPADINKDYILKMVNRMKPGE